MLLPHVGESVLYPVEKFASYDRPQVVSGNHYHEWVNACLNDTDTSASFSYGGPLTEALLLGVVANRFPGQTLQVDRYGSLIIRPSGEDPARKPG